MKEKEAEDSLLSASQVKTLLDKVGGIEIPMAKSEVGDLVPHNSAHVKKLFYIIDTVTELQQQVRLLSHDKEELQSTITTQILEIEHLKEEVEKLVRDRQDSKKVKDELSELTFGLEKIIGILGGELFDQKSAGVKGHLSVLEKQVVTMPLELENSKSKTQELGTKFLASQKVVDELSIKVKVLEDSLQDRSAQTEIGQESSIFEAPSLPTGSEISEIKDAGSLGQTSKCPVLPATVARTVRKGSAEHLAINVDVESERLINNEGSDEDKDPLDESSVQERTPEYERSLSYNEAGSSDRLAKAAEEEVQSTSKPNNNTNVIKLKTSTSEIENTSKEVQKSAMGARATDSARLMKFTKHFLGQQSY
ncbi:trans-Golgi network-localized SYP41-interacting protein 1-like isoform X1 [Castanea sativa]|uniref:trans-Golgi network-localized SYP41-interacting protein 1-like isoform X1 n=1 Tax=Castanea sativa TaxID=21020 RepID=UPI003F649F8B